VVGLSVLWLKRAKISQSHSGCAAKRTLKVKLRLRDSTPTSRAYHYRLLGNRYPDLHFHG
jgi:hypothetical protein